MEFKILTSIAQAQCAVGATSDLVSIVIILAIILPEAHRANLERAS